MPGNSGKQNNSKNNYKKLVPTSELVKNEFCHILYIGIFNSKELLLYNLCLPHQARQRV